MAIYSIIVIAVIDARQEDGIMTLDVTNTFVKTKIDQKEGGEKIIMKIRGTLVDMLIEIFLEQYEEHVVYEGKHKVLYVKILEALYEILKASILYHKNSK